MTLLLWVSVGLIAIDALGIAYFLRHRFLVAPESTSLVEFTPFLVALGALIALVAFLMNLRRARSEDLLGAAVDLFEKGYAVLESEPGSKTPSQRRISWLMAARLLATAESIGGRISEPSHRRIYGDVREYWRSRFNDLIFPRPPQGLPAEFYAESAKSMIAYSDGVREPMSERSLAYLYRFIRWPDGAKDPIGDIPDFTDVEIDRMKTFGPVALGHLIHQVREIIRGVRQ